MMYTSGNAAKGAVISSTKGTIMTNITDKEDFIHHASLAFFASAWAEQCEASDNEEMLSGQEIMQIMPHDVDLAAIEAAQSLLDKMELQNNLAIEDMLAYIEDNGDGDRDPTIEFFGHYAAMQAMGTGVGLREAFGKDVSEAIQVPYMDFGKYSLEKDYF